MKQLLSFLMSLVLVSAVVFPPQVAEAIGAREIVQTIKLAGQEFKAVSRMYGADAAARRVAVDLYDTSKNLVKSFMIDAADPKVLAELTPSKLKARLASQVIDKGGKLTSLAKQQLIRFPVESFSFFLALGAGAAKQAMLDYADDPLAWDHFLGQQKDPVGQLSFYAFMLANASSSQAMMSAIDKRGIVIPGLRGVISYMGMSVGMMASNIVSEASQSPHFMSCLKSATLDSKECDAAYAAWTKSGGFLGTLWTWSPGIASMTIAAITSSIFQMGLTYTTQQVLKIVGIELGTLFVPGADASKIVVWTLKGIKWVGTSAASLALFTQIQHKIDPFFTEPFYNHTQGKTLDQLETNLVNQLAGLQATNWNSAKLEDTMNKMTEAMKAWREMNLQEVSIAQSSWSSNLNNFAGLYNIGKAYYEAIIGEARTEIKYQQTSPYQSVFLRRYPMNGITPIEIDFTKGNIYLESPEKIAEKQLKNVQAISTQIDKYYSDNQKMVDTLSPGNREFLNSLRADLRSQNPVKIGQAMERLNFKIKDISESSMGLAPQFLNHLIAIKKMLGNPKPIWQIGAGATNYFLLGADWAHAEELVHKNKFGNYDSSKIANWLMGSTMWGPDASSLQLTDTKAGFFSQFLLPRLPVRGQHSPWVCTTSLSAVTSICDGDKRYDTPTHFAISNLDASLLNQNGFESWWKETSEKTYVKAWVNFENKYQPIVAKLAEKLWRSDNNYWNNSSVNNGIVEAAFQEMKLNAMILGGLMKVNLDPSLTTNATSRAEKASVYQQLISKSANASWMQTTNIQAGEYGKHAKLMAILRQNSNLDLRSVLQTQGVDMSEVPMVGATYNFSWQNELMNQMIDMKNLIRQIKPVTVTLADGETISSTSSQITNAQLHEQQQKTEETLNQLQDLIGAKAEKENQMIYFTPEQQKIADLCIKNMRSVYNDLTMMAMIVNAVSYRDVLNNNGEMVQAHCTKPQTTAGRGMQFVKAAVEGCE